MDFFVSGAQKAGTSALDFYLRQHPEVCMASRKEVHFFDNDANFTNELPCYNIYHAFFRPQPQHRILGETTPAYMYWLTAPKRLWEYNPAAKHIVVLRNPIERAYSHWNMQRKIGIEPRSFWQALHTEREKCRESLPFQNKPYSYIDRGFYSEQLRRLLYYFPGEQLLILKCEDLKAQPRDTLDRIWRFIGVASHKDIKFAIVHSNPYGTSMTDKERRYLLDVYEFEIKQLERMLGWDCSDWLSDS